jgi:TetR/AcrR family transcriptional regulator, transcriptional repressor for nem operon
MARPRDFDLVAALDAAVISFWEQGYSATSVRQLCKAMGIKAGSFYAAFGSKEACFRMALERYLATQPLPREPGPAAIRLWLDAVTDPARTPRGCLLVDTAVEHPLIDAASQALVRERLRAMESFFRRSLGGQPGAREDAALLSAAVVAIHVLARTGAPATALRRIADRALAAVGLLSSDLQFLNDR